MSIYTSVKFLHVCGAIGYFVATGTWRERTVGLQFMPW
jgi:hypothetical protein